jgi:hypothetical protein
LKSFNVKYQKGADKKTYVASSFIDNTGFSFVGDQDVRVGKLAMPIMIDDQIQGVMVWEEAIDKKFAELIIP